MAVWTRPSALASLVILSSAGPESPKSSDIFTTRGQGRDELEELKDA
jgi:hypothetical protein